MTSTAIPISSAAINQIKAVILQGTPTYVYGLSYDVGTCRAGGVSLSFSSLFFSFFFSLSLQMTNFYISLMHDPRALCARRPRKSNPTAMRLTPTVAMAAMLLPTRDMVPSTARRPSPLSRVSSAAALPERRPPHLLAPHQPRHRLAAHVPRCTVNVVVSVGPARLVALLVLASTLIRTTPSVCKYYYWRGGNSYGGGNCNPLYIFRTDCTYIWN